MWGRSACAVQGFQRCACAPLMRERPLCGCDSVLDPDKWLFLGLVLCVLWQPAGGELGAPALGRLEIVGSPHRDSDDGVR